jgi:hypothetical protein
MDTLILSKGMPSKSAFMSSTLSTATPALPYVSHHSRVIGVVSTMCRKVESHRQSGLTGSKVSAVKRITFSRGRESGVLTDRPRFLHVHRRIRPAQEKGPLRPCSQDAHSPRHHPACRTTPPESVRWSATQGPWPSDPPLAGPQRATGTRARRNLEYSSSDLFCSQSKPMVNRREKLCRIGSHVNELIHPLRPVHFHVLARMTGENQKRRKLEALDRLRDGRD